MSFHLMATSVTFHLMANAFSQLTQTFLGKIWQVPLCSVPLKISSCSPLPRPKLVHTPAVSRPHQTSAQDQGPWRVIPTLWPPLSRAQSPKLGPRRVGEVTLGSFPDLDSARLLGTQSFQHAALWMILNPHWARTQSCYQAQNHLEQPQTPSSHTQGSSVDPQDCPPKTEGQKAPPRGSQGCNSALRLPAALLPP